MALPWSTWKRGSDSVFVWPTMPSTYQDNGAYMDSPKKEVSTQNKLKHFSGTKKLGNLIRVYQWRKRWRERDNNDGMPATAFTWNPNLLPWCCYQHTWGRGGGQQWKWDRWWLRRSLGYVGNSNFWFQFLKPQSEAEFWFRFRLQVFRLEIFRKHQIGIPICKIRNSVSIFTSELSTSHFVYIPRLTSVNTCNIFSRQNNIHLFYLENE